jgi:hypothetical protein
MLWQWVIGQEEEKRSNRAYFDETAAHRRTPPKPATP